MTHLSVLAILLSISAFGAYVNHRFIKLPTAAGLMVVSLIISILLSILGATKCLDLRVASLFVKNLDFQNTLLHGMLAFMLFAGALKVDLSELWTERVVIFSLATVGVVCATLATGALFWLSCRLLGIEFPIIVAILFGAIIAPTDPIAILGILKSAGVPKNLQIVVAGESIFNDGIGVVVFLAVSSIAFSSGSPDAFQVATIFAREVIGGIAFGAVSGWLFYRVLRTVDEHVVEIQLTLALAAGGYALAEAIHVSAPIAIAAAGLVIGNHGRAFAMSESTRKNLDPFWELIDELLNSILFVMIGLEIITLTFDLSYLFASLLAIVVVLMARWCSIIVPLSLVKAQNRLGEGSVKILTWGGLRGGLSLALVLSLPAFTHHDLLIYATYFVVVFSVLVQGTTLSRIAQRYAN